MVGRERDDDDASSPTLYFVRADDCSFGVVTALHYDVRLESVHELERRVFREHDDEIHALDGSENQSALVLITYGPALTLEPADRGIAVDANDESIGSRARRHKKINVSWMQEVEDSVGERYSILSCRPPAFGLGSRRYFGRRVTRLQNVLLITSGWK